MNSTLLARSALLLPLFVGLGCKTGKNDTAAKTTTPRTPVAAAVQELSNNTNPVVVGTDARGTLGSIERHDPALDALISKDAKIEILAKGLDWSEGPVWSTAEQCLYFSDVPQNVVYRWSEKGGLKVHLKPSGYWGATPRGGEPGSNGLTFDREGRLVLCQHGERRVARIEADGRQTTLVDRYEGKRFNSPNDLTFDSKGNLFFTDPPYGLEGKLQDPKKEIPFQGVYRLSADRKLTLVTDQIKFPNGIALSPDERTLYVAESNSAKPQIWAMDLKPDGTASNLRTFFDASPLAAKKLKGLPDGMKVDAQGNLWATGPGGVLILSPQGKHLGTILTEQNTGNCAWGDDGSTLYFMADMYLCRVKTSTRGKIPG